MKSKLKYLLLFLVVATTISSQQISLALKKTILCQFKGRLICLGLQETPENLGLKIYTLQKDLKLSDSSYVAVLPSGADSYLDLSYDTLHDFLNVYLQKKEAKELTIYRFNRNLDPVATIPHVEVARLNNANLFSAETLFSGNSVYTLKTEKDSTGNQFYVNKYELKSDKENFDYLFKWQFPFERKNISAAHLFYADKRMLLLHVFVSSGTKVGQWILKLNTVDGTLLKASKINDKGDNSSYFYSQVYQDQGSQSLLLAGQKLSTQQFDPATQKTNFSSATNLSLYILRLDSFGEVKEKKEFKLPIVDLPSGSKKTAASYLVQITSFKKNSNGQLTMEADVFRSGNNAPCFGYVNTLPLTLIEDELGFVLSKTTIQQNKLIEDYYASADKLDMNGKLCTDASNYFSRMFYRKISFPIICFFKTDAESNPVWILQKSNSGKKTIDYSLLGPVGRVYKLSPLEVISKSAKPFCLRTGENTILIGAETEEGKYRLKLYNW